MKQLTCEMCGSTDLIKQDGVFVCQTCGCKYSIEEARKMMVEGTVEVTGTVKVDNSAAIENYLQMARNALTSSNHEEAESYANKIIELDPQNSAAWEIKGEAAGWQSKANNNRMAEAVTAWINAVSFSLTEERSELRERIANAYTNLLLAMVQLRANNFASIQDADRLNSTINDLNNGIDMMNMLVTKAGVSFNRGPIYTQLARKLNSSACDGYKDAKKDFGPEHHNMSKWQWESFTASCDNCIKLLEKAVTLCRDQELGKTICDNMVTIAEDARDSCSWTFDVNSWAADHYVREYSFTDEAKKARSKNIDGYKDKRKFFEKDQTAVILAVLQGGRKEEEIELGKKIYWQEHDEERLQLEAEKKRLEQENAETSAKLSSLPISAQKTETQKKISDLEGKQKSLGIFKGKEKKALQIQIDELSVLYSRQEDEEKTVQRPLNDIIEKNKKRIAEIEAEFSKSRGQVSVGTGNFAINDVLLEGKFTISPKALGEHLASIIPSPYKFVELKSASSPLAEFGNQWELCFIKTDEDEKNNNIGLNIYCTAPDEDAPIENIIIEGIPAISSTEKVSRSWVIFGAYIFMSLMAELSLNEAEKIAADLRYTKDCTLWLRNDIRYEYASSEINLLGLLKISKDLLLIRPND